MIQIILLEDGVRVAGIDYPLNHLTFGIERSNIVEIFDAGEKVVSAPYTEFLDSRNKPYISIDAVIADLESSYTNNSSDVSVDVNAIGIAINGATSATPNDTDLVMSVESSVAKKNTWTQIKAFLKTYFDTIYTTTSAVTTQITIAISGKEDIANKSSSYTASSTTTYANTKALVDGLATKPKKAASKVFMYRNFK